MAQFAKKMYQILWKEEEGQDLVEYALLLVLIALAAITAITKLAEAIQIALAGRVFGP